MGRKRAWIRGNLSRILSSQQLRAWDVPRAGSVLNSSLYRLCHLVLVHSRGAEELLAEQS